jgi:hypothetical protein
MLRMGKGIFLFGKRLYRLEGLPSLLFRGYRRLFTVVQKAGT